MTISSRTPEGVPNRCPVCGNSLRLEPSVPPGDAPCPHCGSLLWFAQNILGDEASVLVQDAILSDLKASTKADAIREMLARLVQVGAINAACQHEIAEAILRREELGSTGIGRGFAVPHAKHPSVDRVIGAMAISRSGIEFDSLDGKPVHTLFLLVSPTTPHDLLLRALENISHYLRNAPAV